MQNQQNQNLTTHHNIADADDFEMDVGMIDKQHLGKSVFMVSLHMCMFQFSSNIHAFFAPYRCFSNERVGKEKRSTFTLEIML